MFRVFSCVIVGALVLSSGCTGGSPIACSNDLNVPEYGFALTVPAQFECATTLSNPTSLATVGYREAATNRTASVQINEPQNGQVQEGVETEDLGDSTNAQGFTFERQKITLEGIGFSYVGGTTLSSGNLLFITVSGSQDDPALLETLDEIIATVSEAAE